MDRTLDQILDDLRAGREGAAAEAGAALAGAPTPRVLALLDDASEAVRLVAAQAAASRAGAEGRLAGALVEDDAWLVRQECARALVRSDAPVALSALLMALAEDDDIDVSRAAAISLQKALERSGGTLTLEASPPSSLVQAADERARMLGETRFRALIEWVTRQRMSDPDALARYGTDLTREAEAGRLPRAHGVERALATLVAGVVGGRQRSFALLGPPGSGKTALVHELVHRLREHPDGPWRVLRVSPSEILAGTSYLGEWQTKVQKLVESVRAHGRLLLYVPNLSELAHAGRSSRNDLNVATMLAPHIESGALAVVGESTDEAFRGGLGADPSLRRLFVQVQVAPATAAETRAILAAVRDEAGVHMADEDLDRLADLAGLYLPGTAEPGRAVGLLRRLLASGRGAEALSQRDLLSALAASTGIPVDFLDDAVPLDLARVREFLESRVMGQAEAVNAVLDLVTLVKAGLTDPQRPCGVLLFVGPTGVGKTELARALAELLFGDPARLLRFDMSEYATPDSHERLIGRPNVPGTLTSAVREHPFSVVLLDEIEKAHLNTFDIFLQVFDAGRLTDGSGQTTDFRRTIVILTSNLGAAVRTEAAMGFGAAGPTATAAGSDEILREVQRFFRPEFVNRLDGVVSFRPLSLETAEQIARREVDRVLRRGGLARRGLSVEVDPAVLALLLREGYSPAFGARPLKRTVERLVLLPVAQVVAHGRTPPGSLLHLKARGGRIEVEVVTPEHAAPAQPAGAAGAAPAPASVDALRERCADLARRAEPLVRRKGELLAGSRDAAFWKDPEAARRALDEVHRLDAVVGEVARLGTRAEELAGASRGSAAQRRTARLEPRREALARELRQAERLVTGAAAGGLGDVFVRLALLRREGPDLAAVERLAAMLEGFARRRGLEVTALDDRRTAEPDVDTLTLLVEGAGARALLAGEEGIHQLSRGGGRGAQGPPRPARAWVRVEVLAVPSDAGATSRDGVTVQAKPLKGVKGRRIAKPTLELTLLHQPTLTSLVARAAGPRDEAVRRLVPLLHALRARAAAPGPSPSQVVRVYELGPAPRVRDRTTGVASGHVERVLAGELELLLPTDTTAG